MDSGIIVLLYLPSSISFDGNVSENWRQLRQQLTRYLSATEKDAKSDKIKSSVLLHCIGEKGREIYNCFTFESNDDKMKFSKILEKFDEYCNPRKNLTFLRYKFFTCRQKESESFDGFVTQLKKLSADCEIGELKDSLIRDVIIIGVSGNRLRERFFYVNHHSHLTML